MRVADYIAQKYVDYGVTKVFSLIGGHAMHLNDAFGNCKDLSVYYTHHEQSAAMAAEAYTRINNEPAIVCVTSGPGAINALNGVLGAYLDSIPMIVISGQPKSSLTCAAVGTDIRQLGDQEFDRIIECVQPMTKYATTIKHIELLDYELSKAWSFAVNGRPGPVWLDVPMDIQGAEVQNISKFNHYQSGYRIEEVNKEPSSPQISLILNRLKESKRPVLYLGPGVRVYKSYKVARELIEKLNIPVVTAWNAHDLIPNMHHCFAGRPGLRGDRGGNFTVQNSDFLLILGTELGIRQVGYDPDKFAPHAFKVMVDVDMYELYKPTINIDMPVQSNVKRFIEELNKQLSKYYFDSKKYDSWLNWTKEVNQRYPVVLEKYWEKESPVNPYCFMQVFFKNLKDDQIVVTGNGMSVVTSFQAAIIKSKTRLFQNVGCASMGYDIPASIGASIANNKGEVVCLSGDGSFQLNLQELQTIKGYNLPIKMFIINNNGYHSMRLTQKNFFDGELHGVEKSSGLTFPNLENIANAYGFPYIKIDSLNNMEEKIIDALKKESVICEIFVDIDQAFEPKSANRKLEDGTIISSGLEDMSPFLDREEFNEVMSVSRAIS